MCHQQKQAIYESRRWVSAGRESASTLVLDLVPTSSVRNKSMVIVVYIMVTGYGSLNGPKQS